MESVWKVLTVFYTERITEIDEKVILMLVGISHFVGLRRNSTPHITRYNQGSQFSLRNVFWRDEICYIH